MTLLGGHWVKHKVCLRNRGFNSNLNLERALFSKITIRFLNRLHILPDQCTKTVPSPGPPIKSGAGSISRLHIAKAGVGVSYVAGKDALPCRAFYAYFRSTGPEICASAIIFEASLVLGLFNVIPNGESCSVHATAPAP